MHLPKSVRKLIESFEKLPGIGPKTAQRLTFYLLNFPKSELETFAGSLTGLKDGTKLCQVCRNISEDTLCSVCSDPTRNQDQIMVVSNFLDTFALEKTGYKGLYHVLGGVIDPLNNIGPEELFIKELLERITNHLSVPMMEGIHSPNVLEIILATGSNMEGESTAMYLSRLIKEFEYDLNRIKITRIARGIPVGGDIEYADDVTLSRALDGRVVY